MLVAVYQPTTAIMTSPLTVPDGTLIVSELPPGLVADAPPTGEICPPLGVAVGVGV